MAMIALAAESVHREPPPKFTDDFSGAWSGP
jgi:hypothetical protein